MTLLWQSPKALELSLGQRSQPRACAGGPFSEPTSSRTQFCFLVAERELHGVGGGAAVAQVGAWHSSSPAPAQGNLI